MTALSTTECSEKATYRVLVGEKLPSSEGQLHDRTAESSPLSVYSSSGTSSRLGSSSQPCTSPLAVTTSPTNTTPRLSLTKNAMNASSSTMDHSMRPAQSRKLLDDAAKLPADISVSSNVSKSEKRLLGLTELILRDLAKNSVFLQENDPRDMPTFTAQDVTLGPVLGHGEFGVVLEVRGLKSDERCQCFRCTAAAAKNANNGNNGSSSGSLSSNDEDDEEAEEGEDQYLAAIAASKAAHVGSYSSEQQHESRSPLPKSIVVKRSPDTASSSKKKQSHRSSESSLGTVTFSEELLLTPSTPAKKKTISFDNLVKLEDDDNKKTHTDLPLLPLSTSSLPSPKISGKKKIASLENLAQLNTEDDEQSVHGDEADEAAFLEQTSKKDDDDDDDDDTGGPLPAEVEKAKACMSAHVMRQGAARYAVKHLRANLGRATRSDAVIDLACEAVYLSRIVHSNVVRLRATVGKPGTPSFMLIMDRLVVTLNDKLLEWKAQRKQHRGSFLDVILGKRNKEGIHALFVERLTAAFDIARALRHLHRKCIVYRDIKPENVGVDVRGDMRIFDFGVAKELKPNDLVKSPEDYNATGLTGSRRYMAPEVVRCVNYGYSADVYSFSILFWQLFSLETPFERLDAGKHFDRVVMAGRRPHKLNYEHLPSKMLHRMMEDAWSEDRTKRPTFHQICQFLQAELMDATASMNAPGSNNSAIGDRSAYLMNRSNTSLYNNSERAAVAALYKDQL